MDTLPIELVTIIAVDTFELFTTLLHVPTIGQRLCAEYPQLIAREKFIRVVVDNFEHKYTYLNNKLHSFNDQPAIVGNAGLSWYKYDLLHRGNDLPAFIGKDSYNSWYLNGMRHRENDLPAIVHKNNDKEWYQNGKRHRDNDQPAIIKCDNDKVWYCDGKRYRGDQSANVH